MPRGRPRLPIEQKLLQGTLSPTRERQHAAKATRAYTEPVAPPGEPTRRQPTRPPPKLVADAGADGLTPDQRVLLASVPTDLPFPIAAIYSETVRNSPTLRAIDRDILVVMCEATARHHLASAELDKCLRDPTMADPKSEAAQAAKAYNAILDRSLALILAARKRLPLA